MKNQDKWKPRFSSENELLMPRCGAIRQELEAFEVWILDKRTLRCEAKCHSLCKNGWSEMGQSAASYCTTEHRLSANERSVILLRSIR